MTRYNRVYSTLESSEEKWKKTETKTDLPNKVYWTDIQDSKKEDGLD